MDLRTVEAAYDQVIELSQTTIVLYESEDDKESLLQSSFPFALPLTPDMPQCVHTPQSSLRHILSATLHPFDESPQPFSKTLTVHTRRFISHTCSIPVSPVTRIIDNPSPVQVEIPRTTFTCVEPVPIYVTVPPPRRELVVEEGLRLRNIKAELIRIVHVVDRTQTDESNLVDVDILSDFGSESEDDDNRIGSAPLGISFPTHEKRIDPSSSTAPYSHNHSQNRGASYRTVISRSGALCRFHASLPVRLRFILHQSSPSSSPSNSTHPLPAGDFASTGSDAECASVTQTTLLHSVSFRIRVHATFRNTSNHTERVSTITIPITFLPSPAPLPEVEESVDSAYHKKHDRPPVRTNRRDDDDADAAPLYDYEECQAGPSYLASGAPPPFEERDAPPPFSSTSFPSSSSRLPTFLESEQEIYIPPAEDSAAAPPPLMPLLEQVIVGEGVLFGFPASSQFSGHTDVDRNEASTPPPSVEMATLDRNVTGFVRLDVDVPEHAVQLTIEQEDQITTGEAPPPPPPRTPSYCDDTSCGPAGPADNSGDDRVDSITCERTASVPCPRCGGARASCKAAALRRSDATSREWLRF